MIDTNKRTKEIYREREVCTIAIMPNWEKQRLLWKRLVKRNA